MKETITYLRQLQANNNREWFHAHKDEFLKHQARFHELVEKLSKKYPSSIRLWQTLRRKIVLIASIGMCASLLTRVRINAISEHS